MSSLLYFRKKGLMLVLSSPSGVGKTTLSRKVVEKDDAISLSISHTTRKKRSTEKENIHYFFTSQKKFQENLEQGLFVEHTKIYNNFYATSKQYVDQQLSLGKDIIFDVNFYGYCQLRSKYKDDVVSIFLLPPSIKELHKRFILRGDNFNTISQRMSSIENDIKSCIHYDYVIINNDIHESLKKILLIITTERYKFSRLKNLDLFISNLIKEYKYFDKNSNFGGDDET